MGKLLGASPSFRRGKVAEHVSFFLTGTTGNLVYYYYTKPGVAFVFFVSLLTEVLFDSRLSLLRSCACESVRIPMHFELSATVEGPSWCSAVHLSSGNGEETTLVMRVLLKASLFSQGGSLSLNNVVLTSILKAIAINFSSK